MFGWLRKLTGGARTPVAPPVSQVPVPVFVAPEPTERFCAPLAFIQPANIDPFSTMFGIVRLSRKDEVWPAFNGEPLAPLIQLNLTAAPRVPEAVRDLSLITIFISEPESLALTPVIDTQAPDPAANWVLRSYASLIGLTIPRPPRNASRISPLLGEWMSVCRENRPDSDHSVQPVTTIINGVPVQNLDIPVQRTKLGGWPVSSDAAPWWASPDLSDTWDFVMQIENEPKAGWHGWSNGAAFIARSRERPHLWAIDVQSA